MGTGSFFLGHRPAVANNFQTGVSDAAQFFVNQNESNASSIVQKDNVKYVMTDYEMAGYNDKFQAIALLSGQGVDTFVTTQAQLDQNGQMTQQLVPTDAYYNTMVVRLQYEDGNGLSHYRLIHESPNSVGTIGATEIKAVKTFEYVEGAKNSCSRQRKRYALSQRHHKSKSDVQLHTECSAERHPRVCGTLFDERDALRNEN